MTTLDGLGYTFNGWGEYTVLLANTSSANFVVQGRTKVVENSTATQFSAFAFGSKDSSGVVEVRRLDMHVQ